MPGAGSAKVTTRKNRVAVGPRLNVMRSAASEVSLPKAG